MKFKGFGPTLFSMSRDDWKGLIGDSRKCQESTAFYAMIFALKKVKGAVPDGISYSHWKK